MRKSWEKIIDIFDRIKIWITLIVRPPWDVFYKKTYPWKVEDVSNAYKISRWFGDNMLRYVLNGKRHIIA